MSVFIVDMNLFWLISLIVPARASPINVMPSLIPMGTIISAMMRFTMYIKLKSRVTKNSTVKIKIK